uniref:Uncharacterized protein n=1 Tax=Mantoniella antarctica TaxID=81844 RepID=A0A7S0X2G1_9CHLO
MAAVEDIRRWFHFEEPPGVGVWPVPYTQQGLQKDCTRLVVFMLDEAPAVAAAAARVSREVMSALGGAGMPCFTVARSSYHVTVFFLSLPTDPVSDPQTSQSKSLSPALVESPSLALSSKKGKQSAFSPDHAREERSIDDACRGLARGPVELEVDRIVMAASGTLLMLFRDPSGCLAPLRGALRETFPGAPAKQTNIAHCTLLRAFPDPDAESGVVLDPRVVEDVNAACVRWSARLQGAKVRLDRAWLVREERFSSLDGPKESFKL